MNKIVFTFLLFATCIFASAQEHLLFKGIQIDGDLPTFIAALEKEGFIYLDDEEVAPNTAALTG